MAAESAVEELVECEATEFVSVSTPVVVNVSVRPTVEALERSVKMFALALGVAVSLLK